MPKGHHTRRASAWSEKKEKRFISRLSEKKLLWLKKVYFFGYEVLVLAFNLDGNGFCDKDRIVLRFSQKQQNVTPHEVHKAKHIAFYLLGCKLAVYRHEEVREAMGLLNRYERRERSKKMGNNETNEAKTKEEFFKALNTLTEITADGLAEKKAHKDDVVAELSFAEKEKTELAEKLEQLKEQIGCWSEEYEELDNTINELNNALLGISKIQQLLYPSPPQE